MGSMSGSRRGSNCPDYTHKDEINIFYCLASHLKGLVGNVARPKFNLGEIWFQTA